MIVSDHHLAVEKDKSYIILYAAMSKMMCVYVLEVEPCTKKREEG
jgi:hypothetical protein